MPAETNKFVIATFALWAGDFGYCEELLRQFSPPWGLSSAEDTARSPIEIMRATGALRLRQLWQKRGEFRKLAAEFAEQGMEITDQPLVLETQHLRATVWRTGAREFLMLGYLKDLGWEEQLFERALRQGDEGASMQTPPNNADDSQGGKSSRKPWRRLGASWVVPGSPFLRVELTDMGLLEATALWTEPQLPESSEVIIGRLLSVLETLDSAEAR